MPLRLYYCDHHEIPLPAGHRFPVEKYAMLRRMLEHEAGIELVPAPAAPIEAIELAHDPTYVAAFLSGTLPAQAMRRIGFPWSEGLVARTLCSAGSTLAAAGDALAQGIGGGLAGGTPPDALRAEGAGFCVFNDIAITIRALQRDRKIGRAAVVDLDVHQGDGTAAIFAGDPTVLTLSLASGLTISLFASKKASIDVRTAGWNGRRGSGCGRSKTCCCHKCGIFGPDIVFFQSGVDTLAADPGSAAWLSRPTGCGNVTG